MNTPLALTRLDFDDSRWPAFVAKFARANIFHSPLMAKVFADSRGFEVFPCFAMDDDRIVAAAFPVLVKIGLLPPHKFTSRLIMYASPLYLRNAVGIEGVRLILGHARALAKKRALFLEIRNSERFPDGDTLDELGRFEYIPYQNYLIDLSRGADAIWSSLNSYTRTHIRKLEKKAAVLREMRYDELPYVIDLIIDLYRRKKIPVVDPSVFTKAYEYLHATGNVRVMVLEAASQVAAARLSLNYASTVYDWYAAANLEYKALYPNEVLAWDSIRWASENGFRLFDFGGGAIKGQKYGPAKFKEKFRGELVEFGRFRYAPNKMLYALANRVYAIRTPSPAGGSEGARE